MPRIQFLVAALFLSSMGYGALPAPSAKPELQVRRIDKSLIVEVALSSRNGQPTKIWASGNSWGAANWRVYIVRGTDLFLFREDPDQRFSRNAPRLEELIRSKRFLLDLRSKSWTGPSATFGSFSRGDKVIVAYEVPVTPEARQQGVWYGTISTMSIVD
jgi:hypothetical protein